MPQILEAAMQEYIFVYWNKKHQIAMAEHFTRQTDRQAKELVCRLCDEYPYEDGDYSFRDFLYLLKKQKDGSFTSIPLDEHWPTESMRKPSSLQVFSPGGS